MAMDLDRVKETFSLYSGEDLTAETSRAALCAQLCGECAQRAGAQAEKGEPRELTEPETAVLESWAAAMAFYQLTLADAAVSPESVTADGVRVNAKEAAAKARLLMEEKRREAAFVLGEEAFYFGRI